MTNQFKADVVVVGSGVAGALTAHRLAKAGLKVIMVEAGPRIDRAEMVERFTTTSKTGYSAGYINYHHAPRPDWNKPGDSYITFTGPEKTHLEYLRVVGGTTWQWNANCVRFMPDEFKMKTLYGVGKDWPIDYDALEAYYVQAEAELGVAGDAAEESFSPRSGPYPLPPMPYTYSDKVTVPLLDKVGVKFLHRPVARNSQPYGGRPACEGFGTCAPICPLGAQYTASYHVAAAERLGVRVLDNTLVDAFMTDDAGRITHISARHNGRRRVTISGKVFVLAANGIESPRLLLMSKIANSSGMVGRNFMDHPGILVNLLMPEPIYAGRGPLSTMASYTFRDQYRSQQAGWLMSVNNQVRLHDITSQALQEGLKPPALNDTIWRQTVHQLELETQMELLPYPDNAVTLDWQNLDSAGQPKMKLHYAFGDYEKRGFAFMETTFRRMAKTLKAEVLRITPPFGHYHMMGTLGMGDDAKSSVVDKDGRTHDHPNLFVCGSAVFTTGGTANPTLTLAALSLKTSDAIIKQLNVVQ